jgi:hypothetical protein
MFAVYDCFSFTQQKKGLREPKKREVGHLKINEELKGKVTCLCEIDQNFEFLLNALAIELSEDESLQKFFVTLKMSGAYLICAALPRMEAIANNVRNKDRLVEPWVGRAPEDFEHANQNNDLVRE